MIKTAVNSISAGILIAIGGSVYLACDNKYAGAALFSVALLCICYLGYYLFTGKIGYLATDRAKKNIPGARACGQSCRHIFARNAYPLRHAHSR